jgi:hypothetical protein
MKLSLPRIRKSRLLLLSLGGAALAIAVYGLASYFLTPLAVERAVHWEVVDVSEADREAPPLRLKFKFELSYRPRSLDWRLWAFAPARIRICSAPWQRFGSDVMMTNSEGERLLTVWPNQVDDIGSFDLWEDDIGVGLPPIVGEFEIGFEEPLRTQILNEWRANGLAPTFPGSLSYWPAGRPIYEDTWLDNLQGRLTGRATWQNRNTDLELSSVPRPRLGKTR